ncbi:Type I Iterative PKS [Podospora pseudoanserina]|uniref:Type I Iterative PKS n=1 Tax=Podospora pseudoanserina TaxID=2609844 RepID=A0ABR0I724_9PEZI|nr:Type I Iterative PKS [Podospora pseudoanserina]
MTDAVTNTHPDTRSENGNLLLRSSEGGNTSTTTSLETGPTTPPSSNSDPLTCQAPIAICGLALRLPGGINDATSFWDALYNGRDMRTPTPKSRFNALGFSKEHSSVGLVPQHGYFLDQDIAAFDTSFFSCRKAELERMDPQIRQLLEVTRECLENAGETQYRGKRIGCYIGTFGEDWLLMQAKDSLQGGSGHNVGHMDLLLANRVSYEFGLSGPSMVIKTGCSASLVALHEACRALQAGDADAAVVGGSSLILTPKGYEILTSEGIFSPEGSCKPFDAAADGYGRAEGVNAVFLKRLDDAVRDGNPVRAVIRGSGTNANGHSRDGLISPDSATQAALIRSVYESTGLDVKDTGYIECHGTGTKEGDRKEAIAVADVFGGAGILMGSVKANVGHSGGASGLTSLIKAVLTLEKKVIPPQIKFHNPAPNIPFEQGRLEVPMKPTQWPVDRSERISINSFGIGGANAHVIVETVKEFCPSLVASLIDENAQDTSSPSLLLVSANCPSSLKQNTDNITNYNHQHQDNLKHLSYTLALHREHLNHRSFVIAGKDGPEEPVPARKADAQPPKVVMVFSGQGAQWPQMGLELLREDPEFRNDISVMNDVLQSSENPPAWSLEDELSKRPEESQIYEAEFSQPLCTALQLALVRSLAGKGIHPDAVIGHSSGEIAGAYAAGVLSLSEAIIIAYYRGFIMKESVRPGAMAAVGLGSEDVTLFLADGATIAAENSPNSTTISGDIPAVEQTMSAVRNAFPEAFCKKLAVNTAYHSSHMNEPATRYLELLRRELPNANQQRKPTIPWYSTVSGGLHEDPIDLSYWATNLTSKVKFLSAARSVMESLPNSVFLEVGPHSQLKGPLRQIVTHKNVAFEYIPTAIRKENSNKTLLTALGSLWQHGLTIDFASFLSGKVLHDLAPYSWNHSTRYWSESRISKDWRQAEFSRHALLGRRIEESSGLEPSWRNLLDVEDEEWLADHKVKGDIIFPFAGYVAMAGEAIRQLTKVETGYSLRNIVVHTALLLHRGKAAEIVTSLRPQRLTEKADSGFYHFSISSFTGSGWIKHCEGLVKPAAKRSVKAENAPTSLPRKVSSQKMYSSFGRIGIEFGPTFPHRSDTTPLAVEAKASIDLKRTEVNARGPDSSLALRLRGFKVSRLDDDEKVDVDRHAACRITWHSHVDFAKKEALIIPPNTPATMPKNRLLVEELALLMLLDMEEASRAMEPEAGHLKMYKLWLQRCRLGALEGGYPVLGSEAVFNFLGLEIYDRNTAIKSRLSTLQDRSPEDGIWKAMQRVYMNSEWLLKEDITAIELLIHDGLLRELYRGMTFDVSPFVKSLCVSKPGLRILEIGAGTGGTTSAILEGIVLPGQKPPYAQYTFTDVSAGFFPEAQARFKDQPNMEYKVLDASSNPLEQGFEPQSYDLIVAVNVIHALPSLHESLSGLKTLLRPGGQLLLTEICGHTFVPGLVFGYFPGWWLGAADDRKWAPHVSVARWDTELQAAGFSGVTTTVLDAAEPFHMCTTLLAQAPPVHQLAEIAAGKIALLHDDPDSPVTKKLIYGLESDRYEVLKVKLGEELPPNMLVISTLDHESPFFEDISPTRFQAFQRLCEGYKSEELLWLMPLTSSPGCENPRAGQTPGALGVFRNENSLPFFTLEIADDEPDFARLVIDVLKKIVERDDGRRVEEDRVFVVRGGLVQVPRLESISILTDTTTESHSSASNTDAIAKRLELGQVGALSSLRWKTYLVDRDGLGPDEVALETKAVGLNFKDVVGALGLIDFGSDEIPIGVEVSGIISQVGANVKHLVVGDRVAGFNGNGCFSTHAVLHGLNCVKIPDDMQFEQAAAIPVVYSTVFYALIEVAHLSAGQTILIHSGCGGVGLAAIQVCQMIGAEVFVTVGSQKKVNYAMEKFGLARDQIFNSRDDSFVEGIMRMTKGQGVDVVLNSLSGPLLHASWKCVAEMGKMIELGKSDILGRGTLDMEPFLQNRSFVCVDTAALALKRPAIMQRSLNQVFQWMSEGKLRIHDRIQIFDADEVKTAYCWLQDADHIGKGVVKLPDNLDTIMAAPLERRVCQFDPNATYLLSGGLGGLGKSIATWMAERGAGCIIFLTRSAGISQQDKDFIVELRSLGCLGIPVAGCVDNMQDVKRAIAQAPTPVRGVMHLAMVQREAPGITLSHEDWQAAVAPKVDGAWNLHHALSDMPLDFFLMTSSALTIAHQPGESNYAAACTFLESFSHYRRGLGLPSSVLLVGPISGAGFIEENPAAMRKVQGSGFHLLTEREFLDFVEFSVQHQRPQSGGDELRCSDDGHIVMAVRSEVPLSDPKCRAPWRRDPLMGSHHNIVSEAEAGVSKIGTSLTAAEELAFRARGNLTVLEEAGAADVFGLEIGRRVRAIMMSDDQDVDVGQTLQQLGVDSLMAVELRRWWKLTFGVEVTTLEIMGGGTLHDLGTATIKKMRRLMDEQA